MSFSRRVLHMDPCPWSAQGKPADATGYPLRSSYPGQAGAPLLLMILIRAPRVPVPTGTHGESQAMAGRLSLTAHENKSQLTDCYGPDLCKAVLLCVRRGVNGTGSRPRLGRLRTGKR
jgi:hypothetical protein